MGKQQTLQTVITLSGKVDNNFGNIGEALLNIGNQVDALSQKVINFGKQDIQKFINYDDVMREVQALGEYDDKTMQLLSDYNKSIAQTSKYTMEQAGQAEVLMAQLGLNMEQTKTLMPNVMNLATAANIELADSLDYLYYTLNALDVPMDYANTLSDQMSKTAAVSSANIDTLGQSMQRLGSGAQFFAGGSSEILAILGGISQFGSDMQGSNAGTQLRNFMLTLLAPTKSKGDIIKSLKITEEEFAEFESYMEDAGIDVNETAATMEQLGMTVYDAATGELKPAIQIIGELEAALAGMSEAEKNETLGNLFGKRTTTTALNLIAALDTIIAYQNEIEHESTGYTEAMAGTMEGGLGGTLRRLESAYDSLQTTLGSKAESPLIWLGEGVTNIVNGLNNMDDGALNALVAAGTTLAAAGPTMMAAGAGFRLIGYAMTPIGAATLGLTALAAAGAAIHQLAIDDFSDKFGDMALETETLVAHVTAIGDAFSDTYTDVNNYNTALETAVTNYETASASLSGELLTNMITGATLTPDQIASIAALGETMGTELLNGIDASFDKSASYISMLFGGVGNAASDADYGSAILLAEDMKNQLTNQAAQLGKDFGDALGSAMDDGIVTGHEYDAIMEKMKAYNDAMALSARADQEAELATRLHQAQNVSWDSAKEFLTEQSGIIDAILADAEMTHIGERAKWGVYYDEAIRQGWINPLTGNAYSEADKDAYLNTLDTRYNDKIGVYENQNAEVARKVFQTLMSQQGYGEAWELLQGAHIVEENGNMVLSMSGNNAPTTYGEMQRLSEMMLDMSAMLGSNIGGMEEVWTTYADMMGLDDPALIAKALGSLSINAINGLNEIKNDAQAQLDENPLVMKVIISNGGYYGGGEMDEYAEGGRATRASIFGEAGPEWAIPEEHTAHVANLLNAARAAAGFTWPELIARNGGLNAGGGTPTQIIYSPVIHASDARGVEQKLIEDKERLERWWREKQMRDEVEVYA